MPKKNDKKNHRHKTTRNKDKVNGERIADSFPPVAQSVEEYPAKQQKHRWCETLEDQSISTAEDRFPQVHARGVGRSYADKNHRQPNQQNSGDLNWQSSNRIFPAEPRMEKAIGREN